MTDKLTLHHGDCLEVLRSLPDCSVDSVVTDPPYGLSFMGKRWDYDVPSVEVWAECLRVLKPGGHLLAFAGTRTQHRMAVRIEDAGFEIRDMIAWVYGSGFPKSLDVSKAIDKAAGAEREVIRTQMTAHSTAGKGLSNELDERPWMTKARELGYHEHAGNIPATPEAKQWEGWGTALKPALEPITVARKPLIGTVAENVLQHGTGAINVDACRVGTEDKIDFERKENGITQSGWKDVNRNPYEQHSQGRWPANFIHDGSEEVVGLFPQAGGGFGKRGGRNGATVGDYGMGATMETVGYGDSGSAARFFYCAKASKADRDEGCEGLEAKQVFGDEGGTYQGLSNSKKPSCNHHPTVKPTDLMRYLCRLVTPPSGTVLDPFMGSGSTGKAAMLEGFAFVGIEREAEYVEIAKARIEAVKNLF
jgi:site-specific DNA-methyltransferase (adenine-specific)